MVSREVKITLPVNPHTLTITDKQVLRQGLLALVSLTSDSISDQDVYNALSQALALCKLGQKSNLPYQYL